MNKKEFIITITVDTNDADYQTKNTGISREDLDKLRPMFKKISEFKEYTGTYKGYNGEDRTWKHGSNFSIGDCLRADLGEKSPEELYGFSELEMDLLYDYLPSNEYGFHTIESVGVHPFVETEYLL